MADWPGTDELKQVLDVDLETDNWTTTLDRVLAAAIAKVKLDVGSWDDVTDAPDDNLAQAALRMAELMAQRPGSIGVQLESDPQYHALLFGHRRRFGIA